MELIQRLAVPIEGAIKDYNDDATLSTLKCILRSYREVQCMYHCTRLEFLNEILEEGLVPIRSTAKIIDGKVDSPPTRMKAVFVSKYPFKWMHWAQGLPNGDYARGAIITLNIDGLKKVKDLSENHDGDWAVLEPITSDRFLQVAISMSDNPTDFKLLPGWEKPKDVRLSD